METFSLSPNPTNHTSPFNRTTVGWKPIGPEFVDESTDLLLIAPQWDGNEVRLKLGIHLLTAFNRTTVGWKPGLG